MIRRYKTNSYIMGLYIFQFGLIQPIASLVKSQLPVAVFTLLLFGVMILNNGIKIKRYVLYTFLLVTTYFIINLMIYNSGFKVILDGYFEFLIKGFSAFIIASIDTDENELYRAFYKISLINAVVMVLYPFTNLLSDMNYMRFGYAIVPSALMMWLKVFNDRRNRLLWIAMASFISILTVVFGSRGTIIVLGLFMLLYFFSNTKMPAYKKNLLSIFACISGYLMIKLNILMRIVEYILYDLEIRTYAIRKLRMVLYRGIAEASSGRDEIYKILWDKFLDSPLIGNGVFYSTISRGGTPHNIVLQILVESGLVGMIVWTFVWIYLVSKHKLMLKVGSKCGFDIVLLIMSLAIGRLLFSSDMWLRPEYWFTISMLLNYRSQNNRRANILQEIKC